jgi:hypothetical protein
MKGLAKRNNKTRGKTVRRRKNNRKTIRKGKKRGGAGLEGIVNEKTPQQQKTELNMENDKLMYDKEILTYKYKEKLRNSKEVLHERNLEFINYKERLIKEQEENVSNDRGSTETKDGDETSNKKFKSNIEGDIQIKNNEVNILMNKLQIELNTAYAKFNIELDGIQKKIQIIQSKLTEIEKEIQLANERRDIENNNYNEAILRARELNLQYLHVEDPSKGDQTSQNEYLDAMAIEQEEDNNTIFKNMEESDLTFNGGNKRKTHKKRK